MALIIAHTKEAQEKLGGRLWAASYGIKHIEEKYHELSIYYRRDIHLHGCKARFLLAGALEHLPAKNKFKKIPISALDTASNGPSELCPYIDMFDDVRAAQETMADWVKHPTKYTIVPIEVLVSKVEQIAADLQILYGATKRGGDETPPLTEGSETVSEFTSRIEAHHSKVCGMSKGYDGYWEQVPAGYVQLGEQQVISNWNGVCRKVVQDAMTVDQAIAEMRKETSGMSFQEWAWQGQVREWFSYEPDLLA